MNKVLETIKKSSKIAIFAHKHPDPDACGAMFGLRDLAVSLGKEAVVFAKKDKKNYLDMVFPLEQAQTNFSAEDFDLVVLVDVYQISRIDEAFSEEVYKAKNLMVIDHHRVADPENFDIENAYIQTEASCSQLILQLFDLAKIKPSQKTATYLYAGLMGDTDRFLHSNLNKNVFETAIKLQECGADIQRVYDYLYRYKTKEIIRVNGFILKHITYVADGKGAFCVVTLKDKKRLGADFDDIKEFCNEMVKIKDVCVSCLCIEYNKNFYKLSWRCLDGYNVFKFCKKMNGGGHICASGCELLISKNKLKKNLPVWIGEILRER